MKIRFRGELPLHGMKQAIFEAFATLEEEHGLRYTRGATLYLNPTNGFGHDIVLKDAFGKAVETIDHDGPYRSAAAEYTP